LSRICVNFFKGVVTDRDNIKAKPTKAGNKNKISRGINM
jgi:hypothetical protein